MPVSEIDVKPKDVTRKMRSEETIVSNLSENGTGRRLGLGNMMMMTE